jgi:hypothetical protein
VARIDGRRDAAHNGLTWGRENRFSRTRDQGVAVGDALQQALRGARHEAAPGADALAPRLALVVIGAGGALGSALLAEALVAGRFRQVAALVAAPLASTLRGLLPLTLTALHAVQGPAFDAAVVVFDRERRSNGRDDAFAMPGPEQLLPLAQALHARGTRRLVVLMPHAPALLPQALAAGLASVDEVALAALGFEHLVILRAARADGSARPLRGLDRVAQLWLQQLRWMVPTRLQALRPAALARCVVELLMALPASPPGTRVVSPETLWQWVQDIEQRQRPE